MIEKFQAGHFNEAFKYSLSDSLIIHRKPLPVFFCETRGSNKTDFTG